MQEKELQANLDWLLKRTEGNIESEYADALKTVMRQNSGVFAKMRDIMDGPAPRHCVTDWQKSVWRKRQMKRLLDKTGIVEKTALAIAAAGEASVAQIKRFGEDTYKTAHNGVTEQLEE